MGAWLVAARALAQRLIRTAGGRALVGGSGRRAITGGVLGTTAAGVGGGLLGGGDDGGGEGAMTPYSWHYGLHPRKRRRRALTQSDRNDIAFISATLGAPAGKQFAMIIASRVS